MATSAPAKKTLNDRGVVRSGLASRLSRAVTWLVPSALVTLSSENDTAGSSTVPKILLIPPFGYAVPHSGDTRCPSGSSLAAVAGSDDESGHLRPCAGIRVCRRAGDRGRP